MCPPEAVCVSIERFFTDRLSVLRAAGVGRERVIIDPGLGYFLGSNPMTPPPWRHRGEDDALEDQPR
jgi:dihydropteroate synthase